MKPTKETKINGQRWKQSSVSEQKTEIAAQRAKKRWGPGLTSDQIRKKYELFIKEDKELKLQILQHERTAIKNNAVRLSEFGFSVIPVSISDKKPYIKWKPYQNKKPTPDEVSRWWDKWPDAQIAVLTGVISNLVVLDFDGADAKERFEAEVCQIPDTILQSTGRIDGGLHALFSYPEAGIRNTVGKICKNVDIKGEGGYFIVAPSKHKSGKHYKWLTGHPIKNGFKDLKPLPGEVLNWYKEYKKKESQTDRLGIDSSSVLKGIPEGQRNETLFRYACKLNTQGLTDEEIKILVHKAGNSCDPPLPGTETEGLIKSALKYPKGKNTFDGAQDEIKIYTASEILGMDIPELKWAIPDILPEGLNILGGKPKKGKSILALNICIAIATGGKVLGQIEVKKGSVIYLSLEDTIRRLKNRLRELIPKGKAWVEATNFIIVTHWPRMEEGLHKLEEEIQKYLDLRLVVIDTLAKFRPAVKNRTGSPYDVDYNDIAQIKNLADKYRVSILLIHHLRKIDAEDVMDTFSGTLGLTGAADGLLVLKNKRGQVELHITGRDLEEAEYVLDFEPVNLRWKLIGKAQDVKATKKMQTLYNAFKEHATKGNPLSPKDLEDITGLNSTYIKKTIPKLMEKGDVKKVGYGKYIYNEI